MGPIARIVAPVDLSPRSLAAAEYALSLARHFDAETVFVHALRARWPLDPAEKRVYGRIVSMTEGRGRFLIREGPPVPVILGAAAAEKAGLIVMASRGRSRFSRFFDDSITAEVLREAPCAVWTAIDDPPPPRKQVRTVLCALALGPRASAILRWAADVAAGFGASLCFAHASGSLDPAPHYPCDREWRFWVSRMARDDIRSVQAAAGADAEVWLEPGRPLETIPLLAAHLRADLLVLGRSPRRRLMADLRTLSYRIACRAPCPVVSV